MTASGDLICPPCSVGQSFFSDRSWPEESFDCFSHFHGEVVQAFIMLGLRDRSMCEEGIQRCLLLEIKKWFFSAKVKGVLSWFSVLMFMCYPYELEYVNLCIFSVLCTF